MNGRIVIAGGSGFLGQLLARKFSTRGTEVVVLTRSPRHRLERVREVFWDGRTLGEWAKELEGSTALVNLAGRSVDCRYHARNRREILESRVHSTRVLGEAVARCRQAPPVWLNSSTATIYKHSLDRPMDETGEIGATPEAKDAFSIEVAQAWEAAFNAANAPHTRKIAFRSAMVLGEETNSVFPVLRRLVRLGLGGKMGSGRQFVSWIHGEDFVRAIEWLITHDDFSGIVNLAAPNPLPNREVMRIIREACGMPFGLPATRGMLEAGAFVLRTETELIIKSRRVVPGRLIESGFQFLYSNLASAVADLEGRCARRTRPALTHHADEPANGARFGNE
jgi:uncharacterized protein